MTNSPHFPEELMRQDILRDSSQLRSLKKAVLDQALSYHHTNNLLEQIAYSYMSVLIAGVVIWILIKSSKQKQTRRIFLLGRDGYLYHYACNQLTKVFKLTQFKCTYLPSSRRFLILPALITQEKYEHIIISYLSNQRYPVSYKSFWNRLDIPAPKKSELKNLGLEYHRILKSRQSLSDRKEIIKKLLPYLKNHLEKERELLIHLYQELGLFSEPEIIAFDLGWSGATLLALNSLTGRSVKGLYFGISPHPHLLPASVKIDLFVNQLTTQKYRQEYPQLVDILEVLSPAPYDTAIKPVLDQEKVSVRYGKTESKTRKKQKQIIINAVTRFIDKLITGFPHGSLRLPSKDPAADFWARPIFRLGLSPTLHEARLLGSIPHPAGLGNIPKGYPVAKPEFTRLAQVIKNPFRLEKLRRQFARVTWKIGFLAQLDKPLQMLFKTYLALTKLFKPLLGTLMRLIPRVVPNNATIRTDK